MILDLPGGWIWSGALDLAEWHAWSWDADELYRTIRNQAWHRLRNGRHGACYQREPNLRIHPPGGPGIDWHTDADFGHLPEEWNVWVPLTECTDDSQRLWVEEPTGDRHAVVVHLGQAFVFRGAQVRHASVPNLTDETRYSFDFRLIAKRDYRDTGAKTVKYGVPLRLGDYWAEL